MSESASRSAVAGTLGLLLLGIAASSHAVWGWMRGDALTDFQESDWTLLKETARQVLNEKPDREQLNWSNPETGNRGSVMALATFTHEGRTCRRTAMRNLTHRGREDQAAYSLCQQADGDWTFVAESALLGEGSTGTDAAQDAPAQDSADEAPGTTAAGTSAEDTETSTESGPPAETDA